MRLTSTLALLLLTVSTVGSASAAPRSPATSARRPGATSKTLERALERHRTRAQAFLARKQWEPALAEVAKARMELRNVRRQEREQMAPQKDPVYRQELQLLSKWWGGQLAAIKQKKIQPEVALKELRTRRERIAKKYAVDPKKNTELRKKRELVDARFALMAAGLDDLAAEAHTGAGNPDEATGSRISAGRLRLEANRTLARPADAMAAARQLRGVAGNDPTALGEAGTYFEEQKSWKEAIETFRTALDLWESGKARRYGRGAGPLVKQDHATEIALRYRQLAHSYTEAGQKAEAAQAMARATELDRQPRRRSQ